MITKQQIRQAIETASEQRLANMVIALFNRQVEDEKATNTTHHDNNRGFNHGDAHGLTIIAKFCLKHRANPQPFSTTTNHKGTDNLWMADKLKKSLPKYAGQLADIANELKAKQLDPDTSSHI